MHKECFVKVKSDLVEAEFVGVFQYSNVIDPSPMIGGHKGGVIAYPIAVVKMDNQIKEVNISNVVFKNEG